MDRQSFTRPLSHLSSWISELGLDRLAGIGWWWVWNSGSVDWWVDRLGWSSVVSMVAPVMIFFEWVCSGGFQISGVGFWSVAWVCWLVAWVVGVVAVVGSNWFDSLCVCGSVDGLCLCVALLMVWWFMFVCVYGSVCVVRGLDRLIGVSWVYVCGFVCWTGARGWGRKRGKKMIVRKPRKTKSEKKWWLERNNKERLKNNILIKIEFWNVRGIIKLDDIIIK